MDCGAASVLLLHPVRASLDPLLSQPGEQPRAASGADVWCVRQRHAWVSSHHQRSPNHRSGGRVAAGTGEERRLDLGSPEEEPVVTRVPELSLARWQMGCRGSWQGCEEQREGLSTGVLSPVPLCLWPLPCVSDNNSSSQLAV